MAERPIASWIWPFTLPACFGVWYALFEEAPRPALQAVVVSCSIVIFAYPLFHCWTNSLVSRQAKLNWLGAMCLLPVLASTAYLLWWKFLAGSDAVGPSGEAEETQNRRRLEHLTSRNVLDFIRISLILAWGCLPIGVGLFAYGWTLSSVPVLMPLMVGLTASAVSMIWAVRVIETFGPEMSENSRLLWIVMIVATWMIGATATWVRVRGMGTAVGPRG